MPKTFYTLHQTEGDARARRSPEREAFIACMQNWAPASEPLTVEVSTWQRAMHQNGISPEGWPGEAECKEHLASMRRDVASGHDDTRDILALPAVNKLDAAFAAVEMKLISSWPALRGATVEATLPPLTTPDLSLGIVNIAEEVGTEASVCAALEPDRGRKLKRIALIQENIRRWPTIERDLRDAASNGLTKAARATEFGFWWEGLALEWARPLGKIVDIRANNLASVTHRMGK